MFGYLRVTSVKKNKINKKQTNSFCCYINVTFISFLSCGWLLRAFYPEVRVSYDIISGTFFKEGKKGTPLSSIIFVQLAGQDKFKEAL